MNNTIKETDYYYNLNKEFEEELTKMERLLDEFDCRSARLSKENQSKLEYVLCWIMRNKPNMIENIVNDNPDVWGLNLNSRDTSQSGWISSSMNC